MICQVHHLGRVPYQEAWALQSRLAEEIATGERPPTLLLLEHPHTYTFGRRGRAENLLWEEDELARRGVEALWVDRGGDVTYHGPGQLVGYPLLPLAPGGLLPVAQDGNGHLPQADYVGYLRDLEKALVQALASLGVEGVQREGLTGVWVMPESGSPAKIAAIGVKIDARGVTQHGFALNVNPDMAYWEGIVACGLQDSPEISMEDLLDPMPSMARVSETVVEALGEVLGYQMTAVEESVLGLETGLQ